MAMAMVGNEIDFESEEIQKTPAPLFFFKSIYAVPNSAKELKYSFAVGFSIVKALIKFHKPNRVILLSMAYLYDLEIYDWAGKNNNEIIS